MMTVIFTKRFIEQLDELNFILFKKNYFSYEENAQQYVIDIYNSIEEFIALKRKRKTPKNLVYYGRYYITINLNRRTTWYIFFDLLDDVYRVNYITNNHIEDAGFISDKK